jgi:hypothetical protein
MFYLWRFYISPSHIWFGGFILFETGLAAIWSLGIMVNSLLNAEGQKSRQGRP